MKLAYFTNTYPRATDTFIRQEVIGLRARGIEVKTFSVRRTDSDHDVDKEVIEEKAKTHYLLPANILKLVINFLIAMVKNPVRFFKTLYLAMHTSGPGVKLHLLQLVYFLEAIELAVRLRREGIQHLHNHFGDNSGNVTLFASQLLAIPFSISFHGPHIFFDAGNWALNTKAKHAKFIACIGFYCRSQIMLNTDQEYWDKFQIVRCGIDPSKFKYNYTNSEVPALLYVGRLDNEKGIPVLLSSVSMLERKGYEVKLTLLGDGRDRFYLEELAKSLGISDRVDFKGFVSQEAVSKALGESDIFVLPSFAEGIPVSFMEAMASGVPVVGTSVGGISELVIDHQTGLVVPASDSEGLSEAIAFYIGNPQVHRQIAEAAREKVIQDFYVDDQLDRLERLFLQTDSRDSR